jgi:hypothetical protein
MKGKKMQDVHFRSIDELLDYLPEEERDMTQILRGVVHAIIPESKERLSFNVPFYRLHKDICFIWPGSVAWGNKINPGVRMGFSQGCAMDDPHQYLNLGNRKQVGWHDFLKPGEIDTEIIADFLIMANEIDAAHYADKVRRSKKR